MLKEFRPALRFLFIFLGLYIGGNVLYGLWITYQDPAPDPATRWVAFQTSVALNQWGYIVTPLQNEHGPTVFLKSDNNTVLNIYEGCNGINVMIVFVAFLIAFGGPARKLSWFLPVGLIIIHLSNIVRLVLLYFVAIHYQHYFYYVHKYVFTAAIYIIVFLLWIIWVAKVNGKPKATAA